MYYRMNETGKAILISITIIGIIAIGALVRNLIADWIEKQAQSARNFKENTI